MKRTQIQIPEPLYAEIQRVAELQQWSVTEVLRRGAEYMASCYPPEKRPDTRWAMPGPLDLGPFQAPPDEWRELAQELGDFD